jgi:hypothetical protein
MPEEFRVWKERIDAIEKKKALAAASASASVGAQAQAAQAVGYTGAAPASGQSPAAAAQAQTQVQAQAQGVPMADSSEEMNDAENGISDGQPGLMAAPRMPRDSATIADVKEKPLPTYDTKGEAIEAFKSLLADKRIPATMKMKEAQEICQDDVRWLALKSAGERKQALAEYQTKRLKAEKEVLKNKARRCRDAFLLMLAENVDIDVRTRWRDATELLQHDARFKNVEDPREREELFDDFVLELEKKEREDRNRIREAGQVKFRVLLEDLHRDGKIDRKSTFQDGAVKQLLESAMMSLPELRAFDEADARKSFQTFVDELENSYRQRRREKRDKYQAILNNYLSKFQTDLEILAAEGQLSAETRWKEFCSTDFVIENENLRDADSLLAGEMRDEEGNIVDVESLNITGSPRDAFDRVVDAVRETCRMDKKLVREVFDETRFGLMHDTQFDEVKNFIFGIAGLKASVVGVSKDGTGVNEYKTEDGEDPEDFGGGPLEVASRQLSVAVRLRCMLTKRPLALRAVYDELHAGVAAQHADEIRRQRKNETRFTELLEDYFYRSDHVGVAWEEAKRVLDRHSAYDALPKADRKRLFMTYMEDLSKKMESKAKAMKTLLEDSSMQKLSGDGENGSSTEHPVEVKDAARDPRVKSKRAPRPEEEVEAGEIIGDAESPEEQHSRKRERDPEPGDDTVSGGEDADHVEYLRGKKQKKEKKESRKSKKVSS